MKPPTDDTADAAVRAAAANWMIRRDRGLSAAESIEFELWLAAEPRHAAAMQRAASAWSRLDRIPEFTAQRHLHRAASRRIWRDRRFVGGFLAMAVAVIALVAIGSWRRTETPVVTERSLVAVGPREVTLADGSLVRLNEHSEIVEEFTPAERRVRLTRGEAHFAVTKNPERPFIVTAGTLHVRAVGTAFNVNLQSAKVEVLVTEGRVQLAPAVAADRAAATLDVGDRAVVASQPSPRAAPAEIVVSRLDEAQMKRALAWQDALLRLGGSTLAEIAAEFERRSGRRVIISDPVLAQTRVGGRFRADDVDGFAHLLATTFDVAVEQAADGTLVLRKKNTTSR